jgi:hypothetical protein
MSNDVSDGFDKTTTVTTPDAAAGIVKDWLTDALLADELAEQDELGSGATAPVTPGRPPHRETPS